MLHTALGRVAESILFLINSRAFAIPSPGHRFKLAPGPRLGFFPNFRFAKKPGPEPVPGTWFREPVGNLLGHPGIPSWNQALGRKTRDPFLGPSSETGQGLFFSKFRFAKKPGTGSGNLCFAKKPVSFCKKTWGGFRLGSRNQIFRFPEPSLAVAQGIMQMANPHTSECDCSSRHARGTRPSPAREKSTQSLRMASPHLIPILYSRPTRELPRPYEMMILYGIIHGLHMDRIAGQLWSCRGRRRCVECTR